MQRWRKVRIEEFAEVKGGGTPSRKVEEYFGGDIPWLSPKDLSDHAGRFVYKGEENLTQLGLNNSSAHLLPTNTVLFSSRATIGRVALAGNPISTSQGFRSLICDTEIALPCYIYYAIQHYTPVIESIASGATYKEISGSELAGVEIHLPPLPTQRKIAAILSAYDDLIENNTRRIAILEEMAWLLYREWFVHFRFPGHEDVAMVEFAPERPSASVSPVSGLIPEDWKVKRLEDVCHLTLGVSPRSEYYNEDGEGLPFHQGVSDFGRLYPITRRYCSKIKRTADPGDILFSVRAPVGRLNIADRKIVIGRGLHAIRSKAENQSFIFLQLSEKFKEEDSVGSGTIFKSVTKSDMLGIELLIPPPELVQRFERVVDPMYSEIKSLTDRNNVLRRARDLLLPRLVSGELDVSNLDISIGGS